MNVLFACVGTLGAQFLFLGCQAFFKVQLLRENCVEHVLQLLMSPFLTFKSSELELVCIRTYVRVASNCTWQMDGSTRTLLSDESTMQSSSSYCS